VIPVVSNHGDTSRTKTVQPVAGSRPTTRRHPAHKCFGTRLEQPLGETQQTCRISAIRVKVVYQRRSNRTLETIAPPREGDYFGWSDAAITELHSADSAH
jgi:hypothetical protein